MVVSLSRPGLLEQSREWGLSEEKNRKTKEVLIDVKVGLRLHDENFPLSGDGYPVNVRHRSTRQRVSRLMYPSI